MALSLVAILLGGYLALGLMADVYDRRVRAILVALTFATPGGVYFFF